MSLSVFIVLYIFLVHSYVIVLVVIVKTIKNQESCFIPVRFVVLYAEVLNQMCAYTAIC